MYLFTDRYDAGKKLAHRLAHYANAQDTIILALPRGGVPVAYEIANILHVPLDVFIVRKLGVPFHQELAMGALALGGTVVLNQEVIKSLPIQEEAIDEVLNKELLELNRRNTLYREGKDFPELTGKIVILVDDGLATGSTASAAITA